MQLPPSRRLAWALLLVPGVLAVLVFANTVAGGFVYDDRDLIVQNPWVHELDDLPSAFTRPMWSFRTSAPTNYYRPLPVAAYTLLWVAGEGEPWPFHLLNVLLHAGSAVLAAALVQRLTGDGALAAAAGSLFAVHPLATEAVAWASGLPELMYAAAVLGALHLHAMRRTWPAAAVLLAGLLAKETALAAVPLAFVLDWAREGSARRAARRVLPYLVPVALVLTVRFAVLGGLAPQASGETTAVQGLLAVPRVLAAYLGLLVAPFGLSAHHLLPGWTAGHVVLGLVVVGCLLVAGVRAWRARSGLALAVALCLVPLVPVLYVPVLGVSPIAERYTYLSIAGLAWVVLDAASRRSRLVLAATASVLVLLCAPASFLRSRVWRDERALAEATLRAEPRAQPAYLMLAKWHWDRGDKDAAIRVFERGLAQLPGDPELYASLVVSRWSQGSVAPAEAIPALESLASTRPGDAMIQYNLGEAYLRMERLAEADASFVRALAARPACPECLVGRAVAAGRRGDDGAAADLARQALELAPGDVPALRQLGVSLLRLGDVAGAVQALLEASRAEPENAEIWNALGAAQATRGRLAEAAEAWERALALDPAHEKARLNLERLRRQGLPFPDLVVR